MASAPNKPIGKFILQLLLVVLVMPALPLLISGDWRWMAAWILFLFQSVGFVLSRGLLRKKNPALFRERSHSLEHQDTASFDRRLMKLFSLLSMLFVLVLGLEHRYGVDFKRSTPLMVLGIVLVAAGYLLGSIAMLQNPFFSGTVRIQREREQNVVSQGVYAWVRHPGYAGTILYYIGAALMVGGWFTWLILLLIISLFIMRTHLEDNFLKKELEGYVDYSKRVKYRLFPGIW